VIGAVIFLLARPERYIRRHLIDRDEPTGAALAQPTD
jgi:hypothetical protein